MIPAAAAAESSGPASRARALRRRRLLLLRLLLRLLVCCCCAAAIIAGSVTKTIVGAPCIRAPGRRPIIAGSAARRAPAALRAHHRHHLRL